MVELWGVKKWDRNKYQILGGGVSVWMRGWYREDQKSL